MLPFCCHSEDNTQAIFFFDLDDFLNYRSSNYVGSTVTIFTSFLCLMFPKRINETKTIFFINSIFQDHLINHQRTLIFF